MQNPDDSTESVWIVCLLIMSVHHISVKTLRFPGARLEPPRQKNAACGVSRLVLFLDAQDVLVSMLVS
ncbi:hypothetical protein ACE4RR_08805 [Alteribacillus sp. HJP-4]